MQRAGGLRELVFRTWVAHRLNLLLMLVIAVLVVVVIILLRPSAPTQVMAVTPMPNVVQPTQIARAGIAPSPTTIPLVTPSQVLATSTSLPMSTRIPPTLTPMPTSTLVPPTPTPIPPTATPVPPTSTPIPTNTPVPTNIPLPTQAPAPTNPPSVVKTQTINLLGSQEGGLRFSAPSNGTYSVQVTYGAFSSWPANGPWRTIIHIYKNRPIEWGWRAWGDKRFNEPVNPDYPMGSFQDWPSEQQAASTARSISSLEIPIAAGDQLIFVYVDERGAYPGNRGSASIVISWRQ
jgi:hypothetical protein